MMTHCDMCGTDIKDSRCACGVWQSIGKPLLKALEHFHEMKRFTLTGDCPHLGCAVVFFRGDYNDCKKMQEYIYAMKGRPHYEKKSD